MNLAEALRSVGFQVRHVSPDQIGIKPIELLTDTQRRWVTDNRDTLLAELRSEAADPPASKHRTIEWQAFLNECASMGATSVEVASLFRQQDIDDLCEESFDKLAAHSQTIVDAINRQRLLANRGKVSALNLCPSRHVTDYSFSNSDQP